MTGAQILDAVIAGNLQSEPFRDEARAEVARLRAVEAAARTATDQWADWCPRDCKDVMGALAAALAARPDAGKSSGDAPREGGE